MNDFLELTKGLVEKQDFEETEFQALARGNYRVKVVNVEKKISQNSGNEYIGMTLEIVDGDYTGRKIFNNIFLTVKTAEASVKRIYKMAQLIDMAPEVFTDVDSIVEFCKKFVDKVFEIEYDEDAFNKVKFTQGL